MIYDVRCRQCDRRDEIVRTVDERDTDLPQCCGQTMRRIISLNQNIHPDFEPYIDENISRTGDGVWVKSKQHRQELLRQNGLSEAYGKGWI